MAACHLWDVRDRQYRYHYQEYHGQPYGDAAIAAMSIVNRFMMFVGSAMIGFGQGYQPVCS